MRDRAERLLPRPRPRRAKRVLLIRPRVDGDTFTSLSYDWAKMAKDKALDEGWEVTDLGRDEASRGSIEEALGDVRPSLVLHYDHGSELTLFGQESGAFTPGIDDFNIRAAAGTFISTVSCLSARGLGPLALDRGVVGYLGYSHVIAAAAWMRDEFGVAANAANFALLEGEGALVAFQRGWRAWDDLWHHCRSFGDPISKTFALWNRDYFRCLDSSSALRPYP